MEIRVWHSEFEASGDPEYQVSLHEDEMDDSPEIISGYHSWAKAWDRAIREADKRQIKAVDEIDGQVYTPEI